MIAASSRFVIAAGILAAAYASVWAQRSDPASRVVVRISAERYGFTPSEVTVPQGATLEFQLKSEDTSHGFRIIGQSIDQTIPKRGRGQATVTFTPAEPGTYVFECSRMCGAGHSFMRGVIRVKPASTGTR
jgi:heme/copper-type cytochrome/quinol oxidase subunit 2